VSHLTLQQAIRAARLGPILEAPAQRRVEVARRALITLLLAALCATVVSCGGSSSNRSEGNSTSSVGASSGDVKGTGASRFHVVALGDSETTGKGDSTGVGWVRRYARLLQAELHLNVDLSNLAKDGQTSDDLLSALRADPTTRMELKDAKIVLFGIGGADLNAGDANFEAGKCRAEACYAPVLGSFARNFDAIVAAVREIRGPSKTVLRSITQPNVLTGAEDVIPPFLKPVATRIGTYQARTANRAICRIMTKYDGRCIDVLHAFNGPGGTANAYKKGLLNHVDCCYPSAQGQQLMAELLFTTGLSPLR
jgi:lysophospholipase L1-like esterase